MLEKKEKMQCEQPPSEDEVDDYADDAYDDLVVDDPDTFHDVGEEVTCPEMDAAMDVVMPTPMQGESEESTMLWLQREYLKLLHREVDVLRRERFASNSRRRSGPSPRSSWADEA